ncbi:hypothetical protein LEP1GSC016_1923 [Leptospira borgpetersenii serovar Hardjo-bovis str. Sponselee]|uniref:Uncharacterized protein n=4 Tax=Leptospira borgpetersenii TaxID=174 RepID=A0A0S2IMR4_LEPBO|nr:hypothetical protein [Leptospira borgpetersenii]ALO24964.1 hypothetical protein LBBP_00620 [Leptospira borgpetersenii serovar Ballum]EKQ91198.1 hypothetical protein LEP1GSC101_1518 [Leptospira borgpetersenii str. UI 09149]EKR02115.1 hypothetical protein LEP1GSC121_0908 [Leptospira borgpetersenii serovar Castellonis str. 200801910]EMJ83976.1 hypothetical protein LEP1GSC016_1923 [Leptospira borgpetersenii serovar Hardjo-bovis str. Sponselee]EMN56377.1 hypothetical protein LEP1GSC090_1960 [Lep
MKGIVKEEYFVKDKNEKTTSKIFLQKSWKFQSGKDKRKPNQFLSVYF